MSNDTTAQQMNLEHWMRDLPIQLKDVPLIYLAIPGTSFCFIFYNKGLCAQWNFAFNVADITFITNLLNMFSKRIYWGQVIFEKCFIKQLLLLIISNIKYIESCRNTQVKRRFCIFVLGALTWRNFLLLVYSHFFINGYLLSYSMCMWHEEVFHQMSKTFLVSYVKKP